MKNILETLNTTFCKSGQDSAQQQTTRKRSYEDYEFPEELPCSSSNIFIDNTDIDTLDHVEPKLVTVGNDHRDSSEEIEAIENKKWNEEINDLLGSVMEEPINFV